VNGSSERPRKDSRDWGWCQHQSHWLPFQFLDCICESPEIYDAVIIQRLWQAARSCGGSTAHHDRDSAVVAGAAPCTTQRKLNAAVQIEDCGLLNHA
jgi:hypothetical protein